MNHNQKTIAQKIVNIEQLKALVDHAKKIGQRVVWTNGCYDLLHAGHVLYLEKARACGDILIVGLNSDASVHRTKGPQRPIVPEQERAIVIAALACVDYVVIFEDDSPIKIIDFLRPDVYVKGGDYNMVTVNQPERRLVEGYGGEVRLLPGVEGTSTTKIIDKIRVSVR